MTDATQGTEAKPSILAIDDTPVSLALAAAPGPGVKSSLKGNGK